MLFRDAVPGQGSPLASIPLGPFRLERCIGRGGTAEVWSGVHVGQGVPVAVKVMTGERARRENFRAAFRNEVQAVASLDHPGIVLVFDHAEIGPEGEEASGGLLPAESPALALELADRGTLADLLPLGLSWEEIRRVLLSLLDALAHAHARGVVHRDLKPSNILAFADGDGPPRLKLADFGLAQAVEREVRSDSTEVVCGTPSYMAPEQLRGQWRDYGPWTDLYGLGCLAWSLATGRPPFTGASLFELVRLQMDEPPPRFHPIVPVPKGFEGWLRRLLQKDPGRRFLRAADATWALLGLGRTEDRPGAGGGGIDPAEIPTDVVAFGGLWPAETNGGDKVSESPGEEPPSARRSPPFPSSWERPETGPLPMRLVGAGLGLYGLRSIPLLGRFDERSALWQALARVHAERKTRLVVLHGMAGAGKTRLAEWVAERAHEVGGATLLRATHGPNPGGEDGLSRMMARHFRCAGLSPQEILDRMERLFRARRGTDESEWQGFTELMAPGTSHPQTARERFGLIERYLERLTHQRPVLLLLDDVQWSADSIAFAHHLLERREAEPKPILLFLTVRDEALAERPLEAAALDELLDLPGASRLEIPPLPAEERAVLTRDILGLEGDLAAEVDARTGGNPLFAVQLVGDWVQRGLIEVGETGFVCRPGEEVWLPDDLHQVWSDRVDRLLERQPPGCREALEIAAVLSPTVDRREWEAACRAGSAPCPPSLPESLVASRLALRAEDGWSFVHAMLRESLERMAREAGRLPAHHRACAAMLAERSAAGER
ncbi:MAG TPA: protein kinase, partial [Thermoanaerobaculia bacterium]|nr:protein kinase [Thermoanaerobaculia bacterium]